MNRAEALAEARRRWGVDAFAEVLDPFDADGTGASLKSVGKAGRNPDGTPSRFVALINGRANSWEAAFSDADRRAGKGGAA